jgi:hypothetical protein
MKQAILTFTIFALLAATSRTADADDTSAATTIGVGVGVGLFVASPMLMLLHPDKEKLKRQRTGLILGLVGTSTIALGAGITVLAHRDTKGGGLRGFAGNQIAGFGLLAIMTATGSWLRDKGESKRRVSISAAPTPSGMSLGLSGRF